jgi:hypothetical protein
MSTERDENGTSWMIWMRFFPLLSGRLPVSSDDVDGFALMEMAATVRSRSVGAGGIHIGMARAILAAAPRLTGNVDLSVLNADGNDLDALKT